MELISEEAWVYRLLKHEHRLFLEVMTGPWGSVGVLVSLNQDERERYDRLGLEAIPRITAEIARSYPSCLKRGIEGLDLPPSGWPEKKR